MKKLLGWAVEIALVGGLLWAGHYALAAVTAWLAITLHTARRELDYVRALVRVFHVTNELKVLAIADTVGVPREMLELHSSKVEEDPAAWESLKRDAAAVGLTLQTVAEVRARQ